MDRARAVQLTRFEQEAELFCNAHMESAHTRRFCPVDGQGAELLKMAITKLGLSARAYDRILKAARTIADLEGAAAIFAAAKVGEDTSACRAVALMARYLGGVAGDLGLVLGARGGVFITGGVAQQNPWMLDEAFLAAFNAGGRHSKWRAAMPLGLCSDPDFGLLGARNCLFVQHERPLPD